MDECTAGELAARLGAACEGDAAVRIRGVAGLREARPGEISLLSQARYAVHLAGTGASAVVVGPDFDGAFAGTLLRVPDPEAAFQRVATWFAPPEPVLPPGIHPAAVVSAEAELAGDVMVGPCAVIEAGVRAGPGCRIHAGCYVGHGVTMGEGCELHPRVVIRHHCRLGCRVVLHPGVVVGGDGFGFEADAAGIRTKIPQVGVVEIGDDVEIGANSTVDRGRFGATRIGNGVKIDNLVQVAHNVIVEDHVVLVAQVGLAGSSIVRRGAIIGGQVGVAGHTVVGEGAMVAAHSGFTKDVPPGSIVMGFPAAPRARVAEAHANLNRIPQLKRRVAELERRLRELEGGAAPG